MDPLQRHVAGLKACRRCPKMHPPVVSGGAVWSKVMLVGQAPGDKEPKMGRPFAWTAGKTLFRWFWESCGMEEGDFRSKVYMAAVCRCFPGKNPKGGDRVPDETEIENCRFWMEKELDLLKPDLIIPVGKLAIGRFLPLAKLDEIIGKSWEWKWKGRALEVIPLPHPSGASPWHRVEPGKFLLQRALGKIRRHPAFCAL